MLTTPRQARSGRRGSLGLRRPRRAGCRSRGRAGLRRSSPPPDPAGSAMDHLGQDHARCQGLLGHALQPIQTRPCQGATPSVTDSVQATVVRVEADDCARRRAEEGESLAPPRSPVEIDGRPDRTLKAVEHLGLGVLRAQQGRLEEGAWSLGARSSQHDVGRLLHGWLRLAITSSIWPGATGDAGVALARVPHAIATGSPSQVLEEGVGVLLGHEDASHEQVHFEGEGPGDVGGGRERGEVPGRLSRLDVRREDRGIDRVRLDVDPRPLLEDGSGASGCAGRCWPSR